MILSEQFSKVQSNTVFRSIQRLVQCSQFSTVQRTCLQSSKICSGFICLDNSVVLFTCTNQHNELSEKLLNSTKLRASKLIEQHGLLQLNSLHIDSKTKHHWIIYCSDISDDVKIKLTVSYVYSFISWVWIGSM